MEALAVLGGVAAAWTLSADLIKLGRYLRKMVKSIKYARRDISKTAHEMIVFAELFQDFLDVCYDSLASVSKKSPPPLSLISWTESAILGLRELLRKVGAPTSVHKDGYSLVETLTTHVKWYLSRESVKYFRALLAVARESIQAFSNIRCIEKLEEQLGVLKQAIENGTQQSLERKLGMTLLERRNIVQHQIRNRRCLRREIEKRLRSAKDEVVIHQKSSQSSGFSPKANTLLDFVESVEQYAEDVLPPKELGSSNRKPYHLHQFSPQRPSAPSVRPSPSNISIGPEPKRTDPETFRQSVQACTKQTKLSTLSKFPTTSTTSTQASTKSSISHTRTDAIANSGNQHRNTDNHATRAREYINDPNGTILSPRKIKASSALRDPDPKLRSREGSRAKWRETATEPTSHELTEQSTTFYRMLGSQAENDPAATYERAEVTESESGSDFIPEEEDVDEGPSPFQATAGFTGKFPRGWRQRHGRNNLIDHFE